MKANRIYVAIVLAIICTGVQAQYKKASFLTRSGRTYELGFSSRFLSGGAGTMPGFYYSYGRDKGKRIFHWFDLEVLLPTKFKYITYHQQDPSTAVYVTGKTKTGLAYRYNFGFYVTDPDNTDIKVKPFVTAGLNFLIAGAASTKTFEYTPEQSDPHEVAVYSNFSYGANIGVGAVYALSEKIGLKFTGGYNLQGETDTNDYSKEYKIYRSYPSHPYVTIGVRFLMTED